MSIQEINKKFKAVIANECNQNRTVLAHSLLEKVMNGANVLTEEATIDELGKDTESKLSAKEKEHMAIYVLDDAPVVEDLITENLDELDYEAVEGNGFEEANLRDVNYILTDAFDEGKSVQGGSLSGTSGYPIVMLTGRGGFGKTEKVVQWGKSHCNLVEMPAATWTPEDVEGVVARDSNEPDTYKKLKGKVFDNLKQPNSVLFIDEYTKIPDHIRSKLFEILRSHDVPDPTSPSGKYHIDNWIMTVLTRNPSSYLYGDNELKSHEATRMADFIPEGAGETVTKEEQERFIKYQMNLWQDVLQSAQANNDEVRQRQALGIYNILEIFYNNADTFRFDTSEQEDDNYREGNKQSFVPRSLFNLCRSTKTGTVDEFIARWPHYCNSKRLDEVKALLTPFKDKLDKANQALLTFGDYILKADNEEKARLTQAFDNIENTINTRVQAFSDWVPDETNADDIMKENETIKSLVDDLKVLADSMSDKFKDDSLKDRLEDAQGSIGTGKYMDVLTKASDIVRAKNGSAQADDSQKADDFVDDTVGLLTGDIRYKDFVSSYGNPPWYRIVKSRTNTDGYDIGLVDEPDIKDSLVGFLNPATQGNIFGKVTKDGQIVGIYYMKNLRFPRLFVTPSSARLFAQAAQKTGIRDYSQCSVVSTNFLRTVKKSLQYSLTQYYNLPISDITDADVKHFCEKFIVFTPQTYVLDNYVNTEVTITGYFMRCIYQF